MAKKYSRRSSRRHRTHRHRKMRGGESSPAPVDGNSMAYSERLSLAQGRQFAAIHAGQHGGASLDAGAYPSAITQTGFLSNDPAALASARQDPLIKSLEAVSGLKDYKGQAGGKRKGRKSRKAHRKGRKGSKSRKAHRKGRKATRKSRRGNRKMMYGGQMPALQPQSVSASGMLLGPAMEARALSGMNREWALAEDPKAFAPGYSEKPTSFSQ